MTSAFGDSVSVFSPGPNLGFRTYVADRPSLGPLRAAEIVLEVSVVLPHAVRTVWPIFADFNIWQSRYGFVWDGTPIDRQDDFIYLGNRPGANDLKYDLNGDQTTYLVRQVIPEKLIYLDNLPSKVEGQDCFWTGRNMMSLFEAEAKTHITVFMEHTWYSETMSVEALRAEAKSVLDSGIVFWRDYFIPDLIAAVESSSRK